MKKTNIALTIFIISSFFQCNGMDFFRFVYNDKDVFITTCSISTVLMLPLITHSYKKDGATFSLLASTLAIAGGTFALLILLYLTQKTVQSHEKIIKLRDKKIENLDMTIKGQNEQIEYLVRTCDDLLTEKNNLYIKCTL
ncbi:MAG TPA: hypothetical protein VL201_03440 [Patescibacteria group bacterium]|jgi:hypothetical protein|nr:hypothetical protein [Patescibacteria group bacterium]